VKTIELTRYRECEQALKLPDLKQALYDEGAILMDRVLVTLHAEEHRKRRTAEMKVFRRDFFRNFEHEIIPGIFTQVMSATDVDKVDLVDLGYHFMVYLALNFAGIDRQDHSQEELDTMVAMLRMFGVAATLGQAKDRNIEAATQEVRDTLNEFDRRFFTPSVVRRRKLLQQVAEGSLDDGALPMDVLTVLLADEDKLHLDRAMLLRETAFYFLAGAHTSVHSLSHAIHHLLTWCEDHPEARAQLQADPSLVQKFVHESFRLHPSSPVSKRRVMTDMTLPNGEQAEVGDIVIVNLREANRDEALFGEDAQTFNPYRGRTPGLSETGITFGIGMHACLGKNLAAGNLPVPNKTIDTQTHQYGTVAWISHALLTAGIEKDPNAVPALDESIARETWLKYPVILQRP
jgi:cytochrome P450